jgi:hypothetical protein
MGAKCAYTGAKMSQVRPAKVGRAPLPGWKCPDVKTLGVKRIGMEPTTFHSSHTAGADPDEPRRETLGLTGRIRPKSPRLRTISCLGRLGLTPTTRRREN